MRAKRCTWCRGKGCPQCYNIGWLPESVAKMDREKSPIYLIIEECVLIQQGKLKVRKGR
jgi:hypothetical protein